MADIKPDMDANRKTELGLTLLETLFSVMLMGVTLYGVVVIMNNWKDHTQNRLAANHFRKVHEAALAYVDKNFQDIWRNGFLEPLIRPDGTPVQNADLSNIGRIIAIPVEDNGGPWYLKDDLSTLSPAFSGRTLIGDQEIAAFVRNAGVIKGYPTLEVLTGSYGVAGSELIPVARLMDIAAVIGEEGGYLGSIGIIGPPCSNGVIQSTRGTWSVQMSLFNASPMPGSPVYCGTPAPDGMGGYISAYGQVHYDPNINADALYRVAVPGRSDLNRMRANLDMNGYNVTKAHFLTADSMRIAGLLKRSFEGWGAIWDGSMSGAKGAYFRVDGILWAAGEENMVLHTFFPENPADRVPGADDLCRHPDDVETDLSTLNPILSAAIGPCRAEKGELFVRGYDLSGDPAVRAQRVSSPDSGLVYDDDAGVVYNSILRTGSLN